MTATLYGKQRDWSLQRDDEGHRTYKITWLVLADFLDGPYTVLNCPQLPVSGSGWFFDNDADEWAWCRTECSVQRYNAQGGARHQWWTVEQTFSTKPPTKQRCQDNPVEDPLLEPARISGGGVKYTEEASFDRFGNPLQNSAFEPYKGPQVEFDSNRCTVKIEQNVGSWQDVVNALNMSDYVNALPIWGAPYRCVKLSNVSWERQFWQKCVIFFKRTLTFDIFIKQDPVTGVVTSGFDRTLLDESSMVLSGQWDASTSGPTAGSWVPKPIQGYSGTPNPDPTIPNHFIRYKGRDNRDARCILNGAGVPAGVSTPGRQFFLSITNSPGILPTDGWVAFNPNATIPNFSSTTWYSKGSLFKYDSGTGLETYCVFNIPPEFGGTIRGADLFTIGGILDQTKVIGPLNIVNQGIYNSLTVYSVGNYVQPLVKYSAGYRYIQKYNEGDFTFLGIPVDFTVP